uniref:Uncharacterized protein n=1 Tax=Anopheles coluzzii TaxID=1518534 RepID=A0A8W7PWQ4_ANOCL
MVELYAANAPNTFTIATIQIVGHHCIAGGSATVLLAENVTTVAYRLQQHARPAALNKVGLEQEALVSGTAGHKVEIVVFARTQILPGVTVLDVVVIARTDDQVPAVSFARVGVHQRCVPLLTTARVRILKRCSTVVPLVATTIVRVHRRQRLAGGYRGNLVTDTGLRFVLHRTAPFDHATLWAVECGFVLRVPGHATVLGGTALRATVCSLLQVHPLHWPGKRQSTRDGKDHTDRHDVAVLNGEYE